MSDVEDGEAREQLDGQEAYRESDESCDDALFSENMVHFITCQKRLNSNVFFILQVLSLQR